VGCLRQISEAETRKEMIDPALEAAGWNLKNHTQVGLEIPVDGYDKEPWNGVSDYCLYRPNGEVIAIVEAKRTTHDPRLAQEQAEHLFQTLLQKAFRGEL
jgi:type I site-specific restriction endonuclease